MGKKLLFAPAGACVFLIVAGCASTEIEKNPELRRAAAKVQILDSGQARALQLTVLSEIEGVSCTVGQTAPSIDIARESLKISAAKIGADAVVNVVCQDGGRSLTCDHRLVCRGDAVRLSK